MAMDLPPSHQIALDFGDAELPQKEPAASIDAGPHGSYRRATVVSHHDDLDVALLAVARARGVGSKTLRLLLNQFGDLNKIWSTDSSTLTALLREAKVKDAAGLVRTLHADQALLCEAAQHDLQRLRASGVQLLTRSHPAFPAQFHTLADAPFWLFVEGNLEALHTPLIGIVGTRTPSKIGVQAAERVTAVICREGFGIVSGLAEGIDASAHRVGLYYRTPQVAVLGTGIDIVFPASTERTRWKILETGGAVVSEYFPGDSYSRANFVQRNRIQAALSLALTPVESTAHSGTAHTLRFAEQYGRPIFGVRRGAPAPQNELVEELFARGHPNFDIDQRTDVVRLIAWLRSVVVPAAWPSRRRPLDVHWFFEDVLRQLEDILGETPVSEQDRAWLHAQIMQRIRRDSYDTDQDIL